LLPDEPAAAFQKDGGLAAQAAVCILVAGALSVGAAVWLAPARVQAALPEWTYRAIMFVAIAPLAGLLAWGTFLVAVWLLLKLAGVELSKEQELKLSFFPAWQIRACWRDGPAGFYPRAARVVCTVAWWSLCFAVIAWLRWLL
jgi:hypothetical protein